jgi:oligopeptide/dipeptide ABC transporter ATP-binding protein
MSRVRSFVRHRHDGLETVSGGPLEHASLGSDALVVEDLEIEFRSAEPSGRKAVQGLSFVLEPGRVLGVAGESGSGKSSVALAVMGLLPPGTQVRGSIRYGAQELVGLPEKELRRFRGSRVAMVSQETAGALNPTLRISQQMGMVLRAHVGASRKSIEARIRRALEEVQLFDGARVLRSYPSELSGGMCQRVIIAMALACGSQALIADEPTTALDVTVQREIIRLLKGLTKERGLALMMISHDLAVLNEVCDDLMVMYQGEAVESGPIASILASPAHPYTRGLLQCVPRMSNRGAILPTLDGGDGRAVPVGGCRFADRCRWRIAVCDERPDLTRLFGGVEEDERRVRCYRANELVHQPPSLARSDA